MNNLIHKAIKAIQDGKTEYAIGLLEGILEMNGQKSESLHDTNRSDIVKIPHVTSNTSDDGAVLDGVAQARLEEIKKMANQGLE